MKIDSAGYEIESNKDNVTVNFKKTFFEGVNVKDIHSDLGYALTFRGQLLDKINRPDPEQVIAQ